MLSVQTALPNLQLRPFVRSYVQRESGSSELEILEPVVARLGVMLEFQFGRPFQVPIYGTQTCLLAPQICVIGPMSQRTYCLLIRDQVETFTVLFRPEGFHAVFGIPTSIFLDVGTEGQAVLGWGVTELFEQLANTKLFASRAQLTDRFLLHSIQRRKPLDRIHQALNALVSARSSQVRIADLAIQAGVTTRQFERKSLDYMGMSPKMLVRVARFQRALRMKSPNSGSWAEVAHRLDYFDQMHMIRDFKEFAGEAPVRALGQIAPEHLISL
jgi:AraC-like DNA-binding protein